MYTKTQVCAHFDLPPRTFERYRTYGIIGAPKINGRNRYYSIEDIRRVREARTMALEDRVTLTDYAERNPLTPHGGRPNTS